MSYSQFNTIAKVKEVFSLTTVEGVESFPDVEPISPSSTLSETLKETLPIAVATGSEKARSELIISPILVEVRRICDRKISLFSGEEFNVDESLGLNGRCDFLISRSVEQLAIEAPAIIIIEAKQADLKTGIGQCLAEMVAAQKFNERKQDSSPTIYGSVTNGLQWQFLQLVGTEATIDLNVYALPPVKTILGMLVWMASAGN